MVLVALVVLESTGDILLNPVPIMMELEMVEMDKHLLTSLLQFLHLPFLHLSDPLGLQQ